MENTLGFQLYTLKDFGEGYDAAFEAVKAMGIDTIEAWSGAVPDDTTGTTSMPDLRKFPERSRNETDVRACDAIGVR